MPGARTEAEWLGHRDHGALLLKTYSHVRPEHVREMVAKVSFGMPASPNGTIWPGRASRQGQYPARDRRVGIRGKRMAVVGIG